MPSTTYNKLDSDKQDKFYRVALSEFSTNGYHRASITKIVNTLGIAKGSVYQYFDDKYDLYLYLLASSAEKLSAVRQLIDTNFDGNLKQWFVSRCIAEIKFMRQFPQAYELIIKTLMDRSGDLKEVQKSLNKTEDIAINNVLNISSTPTPEFLAYAVRAVKDRFLSEVDLSRGEKTTSQKIIDLADILFA